MVTKSISTKIKEKKSPSQENKALSIAIDYPREEELIIPGHYAIRLSATPNSQVEISINSGEWQGCRTALGYYWFDWEPKTAGEITLVARQKTGPGRPQQSAVRFCRVVPKKN
ncbi:MAG: hypothetical protein KCHDKBKB_02315 [Elusimicrobia bacterium]|nr:hypothetical protein [Elusimicrobiota bacterium]